MIENVEGQPIKINSHRSVTRFSAWSGAFLMRRGKLRDVDV
jgi:hypothetical protein